MHLIFRSCFMSSRSQFLSMANTRTLDFYPVHGILTPIRPGDCVLMRSPDPSKPSYIAKVKKIVSDYNGDNVKVHVRWYYRPEEVVGGRKKFHGNKEVFLSDHRDVQAVDAIEGRCKIHTFKNYRKLETVGNDDFYSRLQYCSSTARFSPDRIAVYCICEMPYNPDEFMIQCDGCHDWFHPACIDMTVEAAREMEHFLCQSCLS